MKSRVWLLLLALGLLARAQQYRPALPGYRYEFPRDHFSHPDYRTEWWYYTGNLRTKDGHRFGFELTFFRQGISRDPSPSPWYIHDLYMAHLALSDIGDGRYYASERINRAGPGLAGANASAETVWNGNWEARIAPDAHQLRGIGEDFSFDLSLVPAKRPVIHGVDGVSQKAEGEGHASHYVSFTRMQARGRIELQGTSYSVEGDAWMDHEFFSDSMAGDEAGWDWLSLQLDDHSELMLYRLRHRDGSVDRYSSGTYVDAHGGVEHLRLQDFTMSEGGVRWKSRETGGVYPLAWSVTVPSLKLVLQVSTPLERQEFVSHVGPSYWEGAVDLKGRRGNDAVQGSGYLEMTGYEGKAQTSAASQMIP